MGGWRGRARSVSSSYTGASASAGPGFTGASASAGPGSTGASASASPGFTGAGVATALFDRQKVSTTYSDFVTFNKINLQNYKSQNKSFPDRRLLELCCSTDSLLSGKTRYSGGCVSTRVSIEHDILTASGREFALLAADHPNLTLWISLECVGGSQFQRLNLYKGGVAASALIKGHRAKFKEMLSVAFEVARVVKHNKGIICFELPGGCSYWNESLLQRFLAEFRLTRVDLDGCMFNLRSRKPNHEGTFLRKHWCVATNSQHIADELWHRCSGNHEHVRICGSDTKFTEGYTVEFAEAVHRALLKEAINLEQPHGKSHVLCCSPVAFQRFKARADTVARHPTSGPMSEGGGGGGGSASASSGLTGAGAGASSSLTGAGTALTPAPVALVFPVVPEALHKDWIVDDDVERRRMWAEYLVKYLSTFLAYFDPTHVGLLQAHAYPVVDLCKWLARLRGYNSVPGQIPMTPEMILSMCTNTLSGMARPPINIVTLDAKEFHLNVVGDSTLNVYPNAKGIGGPLKQDYGWSTLLVKASSGATLPTIVLDVRRLFTDHGSNPRPINSMLIIVWNGNDFCGGPKYEQEVATTWFLAAQHLVELKEYWPRMVILSSSDYARFGCSRRWGELMQEAQGFLRSVGFIVLPLTEYLQDVQPYTFQENVMHSRRCEQVFRAWEREFQRVVDFSCYHECHRSYISFLTTYGCYKTKITMEEPGHTQASLGLTEAGQASPSLTGAGVKSSFIPALVAAVVKLKQFLTKAQRVEIYQKHSHMHDTNWQVLNTRINKLFSHRLCWDSDTPYRNKRSEGGCTKFSTSDAKVGDWSAVCYSASSQPPRKGTYSDEQVNMGIIYNLFEPIKGKDLDITSDEYLTARQEAMSIYYEDYVKVPNDELRKKQYGGQVALDNLVASAVGEVASKPKSSAPSGSKGRGKGKGTGGVKGTITKGAKK